MAHRMNISHFGRQYHPEITNRYHETSIQGGQHQFPPQFNQQPEQFGTNSMLEWKEPPSWADVKLAGDGMIRNGKPSRQFFEQPQQPKKQQFQQQQPWGQSSNQPSNENCDVFSSMGHWGPPPNANGQRNQYNHSGYRPSPPSIPTEDVFENIGEWNGNIVPPQKPSLMSIDLNAPTPLPTGQIVRSRSVESPSASTNSNEEKNSWKTIEAILHIYESRSPSVAEEVDIIIPGESNGFWNSNLQNY